MGGLGDVVALHGVFDLIHGLLGLPRAGGAAGGKLQSCLPSSKQSRSAWLSWVSSSRAWESWTFLALSTTSSR